MRKKKVIIFQAILIAFFVAQCSQATQNNSELEKVEKSFSPNTTIFIEIEPLTLEKNVVENRFYGNLVNFKYKKDLFNKVLITDPKKKISIKAICTNDCEEDSLVITNENFLNMKIDGVEPFSVIEIWLFSDPILLGNFKANSNGEINANIKVQDVEKGSHTLQIKEKYSENNTVSLQVEVKDKVDIFNCNYPEYTLNNKSGVHEVKSEKITKDFLKPDNWSVLYCDGSSQFIMHGDAVEWLKLGREIKGLDLNTEKVYGFNSDSNVEKVEMLSIPACNFPNVGIDKVVKTNNNNFWFYQCDGGVIEVQPYSMSIVNWGCSGQAVIGIEDFSKEHLQNDGVCDDFNSEIESTPICTTYRDVIGCGGENNSGYTGNTLETTFNICDYDVNSSLCSDTKTNSNIDESECTRPYEGTGFMEDVLYIEGVYEYNDKSRGISNFNIAYCNITSDKNGENLRTELIFSGGSLSQEAIEWATAGRPIRGIDNFTELDIYKDYLEVYIPKGPPNGLCKDIKKKYAFSQQLPSDTIYAWAYVRPNCNSIYVDYGTLSDFIDSEYWIPVNTNSSLTSLDIKFFNPEDISFQLKDNTVYQFGVEYDSSNPIKFIAELQQPILTTTEFLKLFEANLESDQCEKDIIKNIIEDGSTLEEKGPSCFSVTDDVEAVPYFCEAYPLDLSCIKFENYDDPEIKEYCSVNLESPFCLHKDNILNNFIDQICLETNDLNCYTYDRSMFYDRDVYCKYNAGTDDSCPPEAPPEGSFDWSPYEDSEGNLDREKLCNDYPESSECTGIEPESGYDCTFYPEIPECQTNEEVQSEPSCPEGEVYDGTACNCPEGTQPDPENGGCMPIEYYPEDNSVDCNVDPGNPECPPEAPPEGSFDWSPYEDSEGNLDREKLCNDYPESSECTGIEPESGYDCTFYPEIPECQTNEEVQSEPSCPEGEVYDGTACNCPEGTQPDPENGGCMPIEYYPEDNSVDCNVDPGNPECPPITAPEDDVYSQYATEEEYCNANPEDSNCSS
jgi:hypothetical protein